jgi:hypothetical protein
MTPLILEDFDRASFSASASAVRIACDFGWVYEKII